MKRRSLTAGLLGLMMIGSLFSLTPAHAQTNSQFTVPPSSSPGAVMWSNQYQMFLHRNVPYLFRPVVPSDLTPSTGEPTIEIEEGVLPSRQRLDGILVTPSGNVYLGSPPGQR